MRKVFLSACAAAVAITALGAQQRSDGELFRFAYRPGEQYRIVGVNRQELFVDGERAGEAEVLTRIRISIGEPESRQGRPGATIRAQYRVSEEVQSTDEPFSVDRDHEVTLWQDELGNQEVPTEAFVPQVRGIPTFPQTAIRPGDVWSEPAVEVYDFRDALGIESPVRVPVSAEYEYIGPEEFEGEMYHAIRIRYALFYRPPRGRPEAEFIRLMTANFVQRLLWDNRAGRPHYYEESYTLFMQTADGGRLEYRGEADGRIVDAPPLDYDTIEQEIQEAIDTSLIEDATVRADDDGVTIALEDIRFSPDSAELLESEVVKLEWLATVLENYPDRDVVISGHTALAGTPQGRERLSRERARAVGEFLIERGVRNREELMYRGMGAREPVAPNDTEENRRRNRRVEITILEN